MNSSASPSLFSLCLGRLNHLLYKAGKLFIRAEVKGGWEVLPRRILFFFFFFPRARLRSAKNKQVRAFVQRCNLHINYPAELISTSAYPRYLSTHTCCTLSSHWSKKKKQRIDRNTGRQNPGVGGGKSLRSKFPFLLTVYGDYRVCCSHSRHANGATQLCKPYTHMTEISMFVLNKSYFCICVCIVRWMISLNLRYTVCTRQTALGNVIIVWQMANYMRTTMHQRLWEPLILLLLVEEVLINTWNIIINWPKTIIYLDFIPSPSWLLLNIIIRVFLYTYHAADLYCYINTACRQSGNLSQLSNNCTSLKGTSCMCLKWTVGDDLSGRNGVHSYKTNHLNGRIKGCTCKHGGGCCFEPSC